MLSTPPSAEFRGFLQMIGRPGNGEHVAASLRLEGIRAFRIDPDPPSFLTPRFLTPQILLRVKARRRRGFTSLSATHGCDWGGGQEGRGGHQIFRTSLAEPEPPCAS